MDKLERDKKLISQRLKQWRLEQNLTLEQVANAVAVSPSTIYRNEEGLVEMQERTLIRFKKAFPDLFKSAA